MKKVTISLKNKKNIKMKFNYLPNQYKKNKKIKINHSYLIEQFSDYKKIFHQIEKTVKRADYTLGEEVDKFEKNMSSRMKSKFTISVGNGTDALFLVLKALDIGHGDEVITTPYTFIATVASIVTAGAKPVFVDIKNDYNIDEKKLERHEHLEYYEFIKKIFESKFIIISSYEDASPRVICEAMLVNTPILLNKDIIGGWKYINKESGIFYDSSDIKIKIKKIMKQKFNPRKFFLNNFGMKNSGKQLRDFIVDIDPSFSKYKYLRFSIS